MAALMRVGVQGSHLIGLHCDNEIVVARQSKDSLSVSYTSINCRRSTNAKLPKASCLVSGNRKCEITLASSFKGSSLPVMQKLSRAQATSKGQLQVQMSAQGLTRPLKVMISGAPASGKGTQCEDIVKKYGLSHISAGDLLRAEVAAGTEYGQQVKSFMDAGTLVPDEVVISIVKSKLNTPAALERGWLLDGYPRSASQAAALEMAGIRPDVFILLEVPDSILVDRVVGRRLDPETGKIYHLSFSPPESAEIAARLTQRSDDTEEKVKTRLDTHKTNVGSVIDTYKDVIKSVDGNRKKEEVFADIEHILNDLLQQGSLQADKQEEQPEKKLEIPTPTNGAPTPTAAAAAAAGVPAQGSVSAWAGVPTRLNSTPHGPVIRHYFYQDACRATQAAVKAGSTRLRIDMIIPETNPEMDVYRIGTLLEFVRELAFAFARDGKRVRVCVQGPMGEGIFTGMPLQLSGVRRILEMMDWGDHGAAGKYINLGAVGAKEVRAEDDLFLLVAPQNAVGNCLIDDLEAMVAAAGSRPVVIVNPRLKDVPSAAGVMQTAGRAERLDFVATFESCYTFRLLYTSGTQYPILGALRFAYPDSCQLYRRVDIESGVEEYQLMETFDSLPSRGDITDAFAGRKRSSEPVGFWGKLAQLILS